MNRTGGDNTPPEGAVRGATTLASAPEAAGAPLTVGKLLGGRYEIRGVLGRGGMGEVWLARDLKLQVEVALKAVRSEKVEDPLALTRLRAEVRAARAVASPHVCRIYDLVEAGGGEYVSMEYVDGSTLSHVLEGRSPLELAEAREIALQFLAGLTAIHDAGLVHRDVKPDNIMVTRAGRVVLMDFGIAKAVAAGGTVAGTPAYCAPEQAAGAPADPRADVFAAGIVLAEMMAPGGVRSREARTALWQGVRAEPPELPETAWTAAIRRAVARRPDDRYASAQALARALEEVAQRLTGIEEAQPYPGLAAFSEAEAGYFFGREAEVEGAWKRLPQRHLLAVVGPSGAGKSSFLRAGLIPARPVGWAHLICTPGTSPFIALGQALASEVAGDTDAVRQIVRFDDADVAVELFRRWRSAHAEGLVVVDQFEELFTLNPVEVQGRFAALLSRLTIEADVHVLLALRDDFLLRCQAHEGLRPVFSELVPLGPPAGDALRRALVQPALKCGYRFEDEALVADMLHAVEGERGALPLLAFAAASLWERRDRERGLLTRTAHDAIGGVAGALVQHAEATLERIGQAKLPLVRELFRNLVTAQGTRDVRDVDELLTVFPADARADAGAVLRSLVDARLLTSYEAHGSEPREVSGRRVEVVHESLLTAWPRLVRWRTEDEGGAQLRDQLRQAARLWSERGEPEDLLWTGTSYQEYQVWRARYPGGLSEVEETFASAMATAAGRKRRRRQIAVAAAFIVLAGVLAVVGDSLRRTRGALLRAEASKLLAIGRERFAADTSEALAYTTASLQLDDTQEARLFALKTLWDAPPAFELVPPEGTNVITPRFSPDGRMLATAGYMSDALVFREDGSPPIALAGHSGPALWFPGRLLLREGDRKATAWSLPDLKLERTVELCRAWGNGLLLGRLYRSCRTGPEAAPGVWKGEAALMSWDGSDAPPVQLGTVPVVDNQAFFSPDGASWVYAKGATLYARPLPISPGRPDVVLGEHQPEIVFIGGPGLPGDYQLVTRSSTDTWRLWTFAPGEPVRVADLAVPAVQPPPVIDRDWFWKVPAQEFQLWSRDSWQGERPLALRRDVSWYAAGAQPRFHPGGNWLVGATSAYSRLTFWPLKNPRPRVVDVTPLPQERLVAFSPDGRWLASSWLDAPIRLWPVTPAGVAAPRTLSVPDSAARWPRAMAWDPKGRFIFFVGANLWIVPVDGKPPTRLEGFTKMPWILAAAVSPSGRQVAAAYGVGDGDRTFRVWNLESGSSRAYDLPQPEASPGPAKGGLAPPGGVVGLAFTDESTLYSAGWGGLRRWDLASGRHEVVVAVGEIGLLGMALRPDSDLVATLPPRGALHTLHPGEPTDCATLVAHDLSGRGSRELPQFGSCVSSFDLDRSGSILAACEGDIIRVGHVAGGEPHLLLGHAGAAVVAVSPDLKWVASIGEDNTLRLWPMPDLDRPPLHTLPHPELVAKLKSLTNLRAVRDTGSSPGWKIEIDRFPGWAEVPTWQP